MNQPPSSLRRRMLTCGAACLLAAVAASFSFPVAAAAQRPVAVSLDEFEKNELETLAPKYRDFYDEVEVIMTPEETEIFLRLDSDTQRDAFLERFWRVRDPSPGTPKNEYEEEYHRRLEHVEKHYGRGQPRKGRKTDRGRMYLLLGEPMNIKTYPWTQTAFPAEMWWFHANPRLGVEPFFYLVFFQRNGTGEFRLYSPLVDGPKALLNPAGEQQMRQIQQEINGRPAQLEGELGAAYEVLVDVDAELAQASLSLIPGDYGVQAGYGSMRSQMMFGDIESIPETIMPTAAWSYPILTGGIVEADVRFESLPLRATAVALLDTSGTPFIHYGLLTDGHRLNLNNYEDAWYVTFEVAGTVIDAQNRVVTSIAGIDGTGAKILQADLDEEQARRMRGGPIAYLDRFPVVDGNFNFDVVLENNVSREFGRQEFRVDVPKPWPSVLRSSPSMLAWALYENPEYDPYSDHYPFQVHRYGMVPALDPTFAVGTGINVFQQIYLPRNHAGMIAITYELRDGDTVVAEQRASVNPALADGNGTINHPINIALAGVEPGEYELVVDIEGDDRGAAAHDVTVVRELDPEQAPHLHMTAGPPPTDPSFSYDIARQYRTLGLVDDAIVALMSAIERVEDEEMLAFQVELMMEAQRYDEVKGLLMPMQTENPNDTAILMALGAVASHTGENYEAIRYFERVRLVTREDSPAVLNPLAAAYFGDGQADKAKTILELSLQVDPEQPEVRRLLDQVLGKGR